MINLGDGPFRPKNCRDLILAELRLAGVTNIITEEDEVQVLDRDCPAAQTPPGIIIPSLAKSFHPETHFKVGAKLEGWKLYRAWTYWVVSCENLVDEIHAKDAMALFEEHGQAMRVDGHCGCPKPEGNYLNRHCRVSMNLVADGTDIFLDGKHHRFIPRDEEDWPKVFETLVKENPGPVGGIRLYHIDEQDAFNAFCNYLKFRGAERKKAKDAFYDELSKIDRYNEEGRWDTKFSPHLDGFIPEEQP